MAISRHWMLTIVALTSADAVACWPLDFSEDYAPAPPAAAGAGGAGGGEPVTDLYVNPTTGSDAAAGTEAEPFKTLKKALSNAISGQTVHLFSGTYNAESGEDFATPVPEGVTVAAVKVGAALLAGTGTEVGLDFPGPGVARGLRIEGFSTGVRAEHGDVALHDLSLVNNAVGALFVGNANVFLENPNIEGGQTGLAARVGATLYMTGGEIHGVGSACGDNAVDLADSANTTLKLVRIHDGIGTIAIAGSLEASMCSTTIERIGVACPGYSTIVVSDSAALTLSTSEVAESGSYAIQAMSTRAVQLTGSEINDALVAISGTGAATLHDTTLTGGIGASCGLCSDLAAVTMIGGTVQGFDVGVGVYQNSVTLQTAHITGNQIGVYVTDGSQRGGDRLAMNALKVEAAGGTHIGCVRRTNEDSYAVAPELGLFLVADGIGGKPGGEVASRMAVETIRSCIAEDDPEETWPLGRLAGADRDEMRFAGSIRQANRRIYDAARHDVDLRGMGTTVAGVLLVEQRAYIAHVGDSRVYRLRAGGIEQLTTDHMITSADWWRRSIRSVHGRGIRIPIGEICCR